MAKVPTPKTPKLVEPLATGEPVEDQPPEAPSSPDGLLSLDQLQSFAEAGDPHERLSTLTTALHVAHYDANPRSLVWVDFCFHTLIFALEDAKLGAVKTRTLLRVVNEVFGFATSPTRQEEPNRSGEVVFPSAEETYDVFRQLVRSHSVAVGPTDEENSLWDTADVARIVGFMSSTFFRHLRAYQHVFRSPRESLEREIAVIVETPLPPLPLALATSAVQE